MAMKLFDLYAELGIKDDGFREGVEAAKREADGFHSVVQQAFGVSLGSLMADGVKQAGSLLAGLAKDSISLASDMQEVQNVVDVTFGTKGARSLDTWAKKAQGSYGMTELNAKKYTSTLGAMIKSMGLSGDTALEMGTTMTGLAADMASFYNLDHDTAFEKIRSGISGETEPLKALGINMSVANLEAYALSQGIETAYSAMTQAEQATLRYNYLLQATADAQGDFQRNSDSYANSIRKIQTAWDGIKTSVGGALMKMVEPVVVSVADFMDTSAITTELEAIASKQAAGVGAYMVQFDRVDTALQVMERLKATQGDAAEGTAEWEGAIKALTQAMPELGRFIDENTGKVIAGTEEIREYARVIAGVGAYEAYGISAKKYEEHAREERAKADAAQTEYAYSLVETDILSERTYEIARPLVGKLLAARDDAVQSAVRAGATQEEIDALYPRYLLSWNDDYGDPGNSKKWKAFTKDHPEYVEAGITQDEMVAYYGAIAAENESAKKASDASVAYETAIANAEEAEKRLELVSQRIAEMPSADKAQYAYNDAVAEMQALVAQLMQQEQALVTYRAEVVESARAAIDSSVGMWQEMGNISLMATDVEYSVDTMMKSFHSQVSYLQQYKQDLIDAVTLGYDADLVASLADGSEDSAARLHAMVTAAQADGEGISNVVAEMNAAYTEVEALKTSTADVMADTQLTADETYQTMIQDIADLATEIDNSTAIQDAMNANAAAITEPMEEAMAQLQEDIDTAIAAVNRLSNLTITGPNILGNWHTALTAHQTQWGGVLPDITYTPPASNEKGIGYVPYDNYLTYLHEGEAVLNRIDAESYRSGERGGVVDYSALADIISAAVRTSLAGVSIGMDGKAVGELVTPYVSESLYQEVTERRYG